jgi:hypothetical protein
MAQSTSAGPPPPVRRAPEEAAKASVPGVPDLATLPVRVNRKVGAGLVGRYYFPVSHRTLEAWPLSWRRVNGKAVCETAELFAAARAKLEAAPTIRGGRRAAPAE